VDHKGRDKGVAIDLEQLEKHAEDLFLHKFVEAVKAARGEHGRFLLLRAGDRLAIEAADDGSAEKLERVTVVPD
jgi:hypothetical protein